VRGDHLWGYVTLHVPPTPPNPPPPPPVSPPHEKLAAPADPASVGTARRINLVVGNCLVTAGESCGLAFQLPDLRASTVSCYHSSAPAEQPAGTPKPSPPPPAAPTCRMFFEALQAGQFNSAEDKAILGRIASAVLLRGSPDVLRLTRNNGSAAVYTRRVSPRKVFVKKSQANKRRAIARK